MNALTIDVLIIGAGQAGLALAKELSATELNYLLVDGNSRTGDSWRQRYDALTLFTPRAFSALPGLPLSGDQDGYATRDEFADYLETYAQHFQFPIRLGVKVNRLEKTTEGFLIKLENGDRVSSQSVIIATGPFQVPKVPKLAKQLPADLPQFTAATYKNPSQLPAGTILVVGDGATGRDIASELSATHLVLLATGRARRLLPERILSRSIWWWLDKLGILRVSTNSLLGKYLRKVDPFPARGRDSNSLRQKGVRIQKYVTAIDGQNVQFANGDTAVIDAVIWATGYHDDTGWVALPEVIDNAGNFIHKAGVSPLPNLYFIGRSWQRTRASALITGVADDALVIKDMLLQSLSASATD